MPRDPPFAEIDNKERQTFFNRKSGGTDTDSGHHDVFLGFKGDLRALFDGHFHTAASIGDPQLAFFFDVEVGFTAHGHFLF